MNKLYKKVQNYENMDDGYEKKAGMLKKEYTDFWEGVGDFLKSAGEGTKKLLEGLVDSLEDFVKGLADLVKGVGKYTGTAIVYNFDKATRYYKASFCNYLIMFVKGCFYNEKGYTDKGKKYYTKGKETK